jgi:hypothetical protein
VRFGTLLRGVAEHQLVQLVAAHLPGVGHALVPRIAEGDLAAGALLDRDELGPVLAQADLVDLLAQAQPVEQLRIGRQQRFADVETRVVVLLDHHHAPAGAGQQRRGGGTGGAAADDEHFALDHGAGSPFRPSPAGGRIGVLASGIFRTRAGGSVGNGIHNLKKARPTSPPGCSRP